MQCLMQDVKALTPQLKIPQGLEEQVQKALEEFGIGDLNRLRSYHVAYPSLECTISILEWSPNRNNRNVSAIWKIVVVWLLHYVKHACMNKSIKHFAKHIDA